MNSLKFRNTKTQPSGFALIATVTISILLVMIALALLSLTTLETRNSRVGNNQAEAQANARMALMLAIGELQNKWVLISVLQPMLTFFH